QALTQGVDPYAILGAQTLEQQMHHAAAALPQRWPQRQALDPAVRHLPDRCRQAFAGDIGRHPFQMAAPDRAPLLGIGHQQHCSGLARRGALDPPHADQDQGLPPVQTPERLIDPLVHQCTLRPRSSSIAFRIASEVAGALSFGSLRPSPTLATASRIALYTLKPSSSGGSPTALECRMVSFGLRFLNSFTR